MKSPNIQTSKRPNLDFSRVAQVPQNLGTRFDGRTPWRLLFTVFAVALAARAGWGLFRMMRSPEPTALEFPDEEQYWMMARSFAEGHGLRDELGFRATRMPLYPGFLALFIETPNGAAYARAVQWIIGALAASFTAGLAITLAGRSNPPEPPLCKGGGCGAGIGYLAGLIVALDPFLIFFSSLLLTETIFITALCGLWWMLARVLQQTQGQHDLRSEPRPEGRGQAAVAFEWISIGALASLCVYARESSLGLILAALIVTALIRRFDRRVLAGTATVLGMVFVSLIPWAVRNHSLTGDWCWLTHRGGISLYDGVGPRATGESDLGDIKQSPAVRGLGEAEWDRHFRREAIAAIKTDPARVLRLAGAKLLRMWNPFPNVETYRSAAVRAVSAAWTIPLFALAIGGVFAWSITTRRHGFCLTLFLLLPAFYLSALHSLFIGSVRYRLPAIPMIAVLAATGLSFLLFSRRSAVFDEPAESTTETP